MGDIIIIAILVLVGAWALVSCLRKRGCSSCPSCGACGSCCKSRCKGSGAHCSASAPPEKPADSKPPDA